MLLHKTSCFVAPCLVFDTSCYTFYLHYVGCMSVNTPEVWPSDSRNQSGEKTSCCKSVNDHISLIGQESLQRTNLINAEYSGLAFLLPSGVCQFANVQGLWADGCLEALNVEDSITKPTAATKLVSDEGDASSFCKASKCDSTSELSKGKGDALKWFFLSQCVNLSWHVSRQCCDCDFRKWAWGPLFLSW